MLASQAPAASAQAQRKLRVMVVDDAVVVRGLVSRWIAEDPNLQMVGSMRNGKQAVDEIAMHNPDVIILDIEMPEMDGLTALPLLLKAKPGVVIIMASTLTRRNAEISMKAMALGAKDYIPKPETNSGVTTSLEFKQALMDKVRALGGRSIGLNLNNNAPAARVATAPSMPAASAAMPTPAARQGALSLRPFSRQTPRILAVGSSTGGPQALLEVFTHLGPRLANIPVVITQHMPATFTTILAGHIEKASGRPCTEGSHGEPLVPGHIYVAPGGLHMSLVQAGASINIKLDDGPQVNFCKPAVDPLFESVANIYGASALAVVLTGMGHDGAKGGQVIAAKGGSVIAQDEASSVVWGMPGATAQSGCCSAVLPLKEIGPKIVSIFGGRVS